VPIYARMRAAAMCLSFEHPKLAVTAVIQDSDIATILDARIKHMEQLQNGNPRQIEARPVIDARPTTHQITNDRRFRCYRGTIGGNLCHNDPASEMPLVVNLLGATLVAPSPRRSSYPTIA